MAGRRMALPQRALILLLLGLLFTLPGCETVKGIGRDLQTVGDAVEKAAHNAED
jgi:predicted small secreted protein